MRYPLSQKANKVRGYTPPVRNVASRACVLYIQIRRKYLTYGTAYATMVKSIGHTRISWRKNCPSTRRRMIETGDPEELRGYVGITPKCIERLKERRGLK